MSTQKTLLIKGVGGLGNRIESVLTGILYARITGRRLLVDWSDSLYSNDGTNTFYRYFHGELFDPTCTLPEVDSVRPAIWKGHLRDSVKDMKSLYPWESPNEAYSRFSFDVSRVDYDEDILVMLLYSSRVNALRQHFNGPCAAFVHYSVDQILRLLLHENLALHPQLRERLDRLRFNIGSRRTVGVHVRYTDHHVRLRSILGSLNSVIRHHPDLQIFLATDNMRVKRMFEETYRSVITAPHWYPSTPGMSIHKNPECPDRFESGCEALMDLYLLSDCDYLIGDTSSSFFHIATLLTSAPDSAVFDLKNRTKPQRLVRRWLYRFMLRMGLLSWGPDILGKAMRLAHSLPETAPYSSQTERKKPSLSRSRRLS